MGYCSDSIFSGSHSVEGLGKTVFSHQLSLKQRCSECRPCGEVFSSLPVCGRGGGGTGSLGICQCGSSFCRLLILFHPGGV